MHGRNYPLSCFSTIADRESCPSGNINNAWKKLPTRLFFDNRCGRENYPHLLCVFFQANLKRSTEKMSSSKKRMHFAVQMQVLLFYKIRSQILHAKVTQLFECNRKIMFMLYGTVSVNHNGFSFTSSAREYREVQT